MFNPFCLDWRKFLIKTSDQNYFTVWHKNYTKDPCHRFTSRGISRDSRKKQAYGKQKDNLFSSFEIHVEQLLTGCFMWARKCTSSKLKDLILFHSVFCWHKCYNKKYDISTIKWFKEKNINQRKKIFCFINNHHGILLAVGTKDGDWSARNCILSKANKK